MTTIETLQKHLEETKRSIKFANACEIVIDAINKKEDYSYVCQYTNDKRELFEKDHIIEWAKISFSTSSIKYFCDMYKISNEESVTPKYKPVINAMRFILKNVDLKYLAYDIQEEKTK